jgi:hypothetical protein
VSFSHGAACFFLINSQIGTGLQQLNVIVDELKIITKQQKCLVESPKLLIVGY